MVSVAQKTVAPLLQQAVQGRTGMATASGLAQATGRLARRGRQVDAGLGAMLLHRADHGGDGARLARSWAPLQQHQAPGQHRPNRPSLLVVEGGSRSCRGLGRRCWRRSRCDRGPCRCRPGLGGGSGPCPPGQRAPAASAAASGAKPAAGPPAQGGCRWPGPGQRTAGGPGNRAHRRRLFPGPAAVKGGGGTPGPRPPRRGSRRQWLR